MSGSPRETRASWPATSSSRKTEERRRRTSTARSGLQSEPFRIAAGAAVRIAVAAGSHEAHGALGHAHEPCVGDEVGASGLRAAGLPVRASGEAGGRLPGRRFPARVRRSGRLGAVEVRIKGSGRLRDAHEVRGPVEVPGPPEDLETLAVPAERDVGRVPVHAPVRQDEHGVRRHPLRLVDGRGVAVIRVLQVLPGELDLHLAPVEEGVHVVLVGCGDGPEAGLRQPGRLVRLREHDPVADAEVARREGDVKRPVVAADPAADGSVVAHGPGIDRAARQRLRPDRVVQRVDVAVRVGDADARALGPVLHVAGMRPCRRRDGIGPDLALEAERALVLVVADRMLDVRAAEREAAGGLGVEPVRLAHHVVDDGDVPLPRRAFRDRPSGHVGDGLQLVRVADGDELAAHREDALLDARPGSGPDHAGLVHDEDEAALLRHVALLPAGLPARQRRGLHPVDRGQVRGRLARRRAGQDLDAPRPPCLGDGAKGVGLARAGMSLHQRQPLGAEHRLRRPRLAGVQAAQRVAARHGHGPGLEASGRQLPRCRVRPAHRLGAGRRDELRRAVRGLRGERHEVSGLHDAVAQRRELRVLHRGAEPRPQGLAHVGFREHRPVRLDDREHVLGPLLEVFAVGPPGTHRVEAHPGHVGRAGVRNRGPVRRRPHERGDRAVLRRPGRQRRVEAVIRRAAGGALAARDPVEGRPCPPFGHGKRDAERLARGRRPGRHRRAVEAWRGEEVDAVVPRPGRRRDGGREGV